MCGAVTDRPRKEPQHTNVVCPKCRKPVGVPINRSAAVIAYLCPACNHRWLVDTYEDPDSLPERKPSACEKCRATTVEDSLLTSSMRYWRCETCGWVWATPLPNWLLAASGGRERTPQSLCEWSIALTCCRGFLPSRPCRNCGKTGRFLVDSSEKAHVDYYRWTSAGTSGCSTAVIRTSHRHS